MTNKIYISCMALAGVILMSQSLNAEALDGSNRANPASILCGDIGGKIVPSKDDAHKLYCQITKDGKDYKAEEWALFRYVKESADKFIMENSMPD